MQETNQKSTKLWVYFWGCFTLYFSIQLIIVYFNQIHRYPDGNTFVQQKYLECMKAERSEYLCKTFIKVRYNASI